MLALTRMLVRVADAHEAALAAAAGVDIADVVASGLRLPEPDAIRSIRAAFPRTLRLSADGLSISTDLAAFAAANHIDEVALTLDVAPPSVPVVDAAKPADVAFLARLIAAPDTLDAIQRVRRRAEGIMFEAGESERLFDRVGIAQLDAYANACRASGLVYGFAGGLEAPDVARLLVLEPHVLGFDEAVRGDHRRDGPLDAEALATIRALIPARGARLSPAARPGDVVDRVFVRDLVLSLSIGAYQAERGMKQRVRFGIVAEVRRARTPPRDMRDVFSYDVMIETVRVLAQRSHVTFVETLAEEIAAALLARDDLEAVTVSVEKLDIVEGSVGIEIRRTRAAG